MSDKEYGVLAEEIEPLLDDTITINLSDIGAVGSTMSSTAYQYPTYSIGTTAGFNGTSGAYLTSGGTGSTVWTNNTSPWTISSTSSSPGLKVNGDAEFDGDVKIKGVSIAEALDTITKRLAILVPDPEKLEHFAALKKAYEHYKTLEALCQMPKEESKD
jgi:hypothetical protein